MTSFWRILPPPLTRQSTRDPNQDKVDCFPYVLAVLRLRKSRHSGRSSSSMTRHGGSLKYRLPPINWGVRRRLGVSDDPSPPKKSPTTSRIFPFDCRVLCRRRRDLTTSAPWWCSSSFLGCFNHPQPPPQNSPTHHHRGFNSREVVCCWPVSCWLLLYGGLVFIVIDF